MSERHPGHAHPPANAPLTDQVILILEFPVVRPWTHQEELVRRLKSFLDLFCREKMGYGMELESDTEIKIQDGKIDVSITARNPSGTRPG